MPAQLLQTAASRKYRTPADLHGRAAAEYNGNRLSDCAAPHGGERRSRDSREGKLLQGIVAGFPSLQVFLVARNKLFQK